MNRSNIWKRLNWVLDRIIEISVGWFGKITGGVISNFVHKEKLTTACSAKINYITWTQICSLFLNFKKNY